MSLGVKVVSAMCGGGRGVEGGGTEAYGRDGDTIVEGEGLVCHFGGGDGEFAISVGGRV